MLGFKEVHAFGFGAPFLTYPTIYAFGWYTGTATINGTPTSVTDRLGYYMCKNFNTATGGGTWIALGSTTYPFDIVAPAVDIDGDKTTAGRLYVTTSAGAVYGQFN